MPGLSSSLHRLECLAREAGAIALELRAAGLEISRKPDGSVVTNADRAVETYLRPALVELAPSSNVWGEEFGFEAEGPGGMWLVDPIDGTTNFSLGSPLWGVSIALARGNEIGLGAVFLPDLGELYLAGAGEGCFLNGRRLAPVPPGQIATNQLVGYCEAVVKAVEGAPLPGKQRCAGAFVIEGAFVLTQRLRAMIGVREKLYDAAGCIVMAQELGAEVRYLDGQPFEIGPLMKDRMISKPWAIFPAGCSFKL